MENAALAANQALIEIALEADPTEAIVEYLLAMAEAEAEAEYAKMEALGLYQIGVKQELLAALSTTDSRYKSSDEGEPADICWMTRSLLEQYVSTASGYGSPYIVFPESVFDLDRSLFVKLRIPFPTNWRF